MAATDNRTHRGDMDKDYKRTLEQAVRHLCNGADAVCTDFELHSGVPRLNYMTGGYTWDNHYVWDSWANFQWVGFLTGRLWLLHLLTRKQRYADTAMQLCERIGPVLASHPTVFSSTGIDMYYALTLGYQICKDDKLKKWAFAGGDNFANIFDTGAKAFLQIAHADRISIDSLRRSGDASAEGAEHDSLGGAGGLPGELRELRYFDATHPMRHHHFFQLHVAAERFHFVGHVFDCLRRLNGTG